MFQIYGTDLFFSASGGTRASHMIGKLSVPLSYTPSQPYRCFKIYFMYKNVSPSCINVCCVSCLLEAGRELELTDSCELFYGCWEPNPSSPKEQPVLLTPLSNPCMWSINNHFLFHCLFFYNSCLFICLKGT